MRKTLLGGIALTLLAATLVTAQADSHDKARELREAGEILPLQQILQRLDPPDQRVLEVELERKGDRYVYEMETLDHSGQVWELYYDAHSGELIKREREH
jgi:uncharacterized membrane protein YkoI